MPISFFRKMSHKGMRTLGGEGFPLRLTACSLTPSSGSARNAPIRQGGDGHLPLCGVSVVAPLPTTASPEPSLPFAQAPLRQRCATAAFTPLGETQTVPAYPSCLPPEACRHRVAHRAERFGRLRTTRDARLARATPPSSATRGQHRATVHRFAIL